jgi:hypothetical protein
MNNKELLRKHVREMILTVKEKQKKQYLEKLTEERHLRGLIRQLLLEVEDETPETSTGMNVLKELLTVIVPILEDEYIQLTTDKKQRESFRAHIIKGVQNLISTASMYTKDAEGSPNLQGQKVQMTPAAAPPVEAEEEEAPVELEEQEDDEVGAEETPDEEGPESNPAFINVAEPEKKKPEDAFQPIQGIDATGRDMAKKAFLRIQKQILEAYSLLHDSNDRELFYKFLITNLKLHFDSFEDSLSIAPQEPTTPEYEQEVQRKTGEMGSSEPPVEEVPEEVPPELEAEV